MKGMDTGMNKTLLCEELEQVTELFYQQKSKEGYEKLQELLADISLYVSGVEDDAKQQELLETLTEALDAMEQRDTTLLADILKYELLEKL